MPEQQSQKLPIDVGPHLSPDFPAYDEITDPSSLGNAESVLDNLRSIDWSFTEDDTTFLTHDLHPYPAKFIPQIPGHLIARLSLRGEVVVDPFGGSGTTALEAIRLGRRAVSLDANPVGTLIGQVKTARLNKAVITDLGAIASSLRTRMRSIETDTGRLSDEYSSFIPQITNREKWFSEVSCGELALIRSSIADLDCDVARRVAMLALSRTILKASYQDSETRYTSRMKEITPGETVREFLSHLERTIREVELTEPQLRYGVAQFITQDARTLAHDTIPSDSADLVVTSPPYANAWDYHLYHRFRLLWLGYQPQDLASVEIGSHLRHQRQGSGFDDYLAEMRPVIVGMHRILRRGRYAALIIGDAIFEKCVHAGAEGVAEVAEEIGLETVGIIERPIHQKKRSVVRAGQRATTEKILLLRKPPSRATLTLSPPPYKLWTYEFDLRDREIRTLLSAESPKADSQEVTCDAYHVPDARRLTFTHMVQHGPQSSDKTWQGILENGLAAVSSSRKEPKYVTHGIHPYKGKFYPQLAKGLLNISDAQPGDLVMDPFCGSGTTLLEGYLNGFRTIGIDMHPLAVKIANAKVGILTVDPDLTRDAVELLLAKLDAGPSATDTGTDQFSPSALEEIHSWFPTPVVGKLNWMLRAIRSVSADIVRDFLEVILSSLIRDVSQQEPRDLRVRRRREALEDADVVGLFRDRLALQYQRVERFWSVRGYCPYRLLEAKAVWGDSRCQKSLNDSEVQPGSVDLVLTSPPYATALPYIDTDRLSLLVFFGMTSSERRPLEHDLIGSREIRTGERISLERSLVDSDTELPAEIDEHLRSLYRSIDDGDHGFRRRNVPALLVRFFKDMQNVLLNCHTALKPGGEAMMVIGDNRMTVDGTSVVIPTTSLLQDIATACGFELIERIPITVTTDNSLHSRNAITENVVLRLRR